LGAKKELGKLIKDYHGKHDYDRFVPVSGAKASIFTLHCLVKEREIKPLLVRMDYGFPRPNALKNKICNADYSNKK